MAGIEQKEHQSQRPEGLILHEALPEIESTGVAGETPFDVTTLDGQICEISISHDGDYANAVALVPSMKQTDSSNARIGGRWTVRPPNGLLN